MGMDRQIEVVDAGDRSAEAVQILRHYLALAQRGQVNGIVLLIELPGGAYRASMTGTSNVAERIGRLQLLADQVLDQAADEVEA